MSTDAALPDGVRSSASRLDRFAAGRDLWPAGTLELWQGRPHEGPDRVFWPTTEDDVLAVLEVAAQQGIPVVTYGAGSGVCGGARGGPGSWVLDTKAFDIIGAVDTQRACITVGAGVNGQHLEDALAAQGWVMGHSPSSISCSTVGGWAAARGAGQFSSKYGVFEDMVLGVRAVCPGRGVLSVGLDGDAPAEWLDLLLGSEGTLAVITSVTLRVWPAPEARWLRGYRFPDVQTALTAMRRLMQDELHPAVVRLYDPVDTRIGGKTKPKPADRGKGGWVRRWAAGLDGLPGARQRSLALPLALPRLVNALFERMASGCLVIAGWEGSAPVVEALSAPGHQILCEEGRDLGPDPGERWYRSRHAVSYKLMPIFERGGFADTMEVAAPWSDLPALYAAMRQALGRTTVVMAHMSHVYPEGGCIYLSFAGRGDRGVYDETWDRALRTVIDNGGTTTHHHGVGTLKAGAATEEAGPAVAGWRQLKAVLDPEQIMNPGRVYRDVPLPPAPAPRAVGAEDGVVRVDVGEAPTAAARAAGVELRWPFETAAGPPRWQREPWQTAQIEVAGVVGGERCVLGRAPRSASGPDLRGWLTNHGAQTATLPVVPSGPRWMAEGSPSHPWRVARTLLRSDLRPAVLTVVDGRLTVGFRGPASAALGAVATALVPGGLDQVGWQPCPLPSVDLEPCSVDDSEVVRVTVQSAWRRRQ